MRKLLIVTAAEDTALQIERLAGRGGLSFRRTHDLATSRAALEMGAFDAIIIDADLGEESVTILLEFAWKLYPLLIAGVYDPLHEKPQNWTATLLGAQFLNGTAVVVRVIEFLRTVSQYVQTDQKIHSSILYVEDLDVPREIVTTYIKSLGFSNIVAVSGADEGLKELNGHPQDFFCILTDINMPQKTGIQLLKEVRESPNLSFLPVLMLTAYSTLEYLVLCVREGATGFLSKPPQKKILRQELEKARRIVLFKQSPRLCAPEDAEQLESALWKLSTTIR